MPHCKSKMTFIEPILI